MLAFARWLVDAGRLREVPTGLRKLRLANEKADRKRVRRALSNAQLADLVLDTEAGPTLVVGYGPTKSKHHPIRMTGLERAALYRIAMCTGFRANEIRHLTPECFRLDDVDHPVIVCKAAYAKNGKEAEQLIARDQASWLRAFLKTRVDPRPNLPVLFVPEKTAKLLRHDLAAAGIPYQTAEGVVDFHALRYSYITNMIAAGVDPKTVQELARHSTITLTIDRYTKSSDERKRKALEGDG